MTLQSGWPYVKPIVIPLRAGGMPEIVDDCEYGDQTSRGIRRSSEVLGMGAALTRRGVIIFAAVAFIFVWYSSISN